MKETKQEKMNAMTEEKLNGQQMQTGELSDDDLDDVNGGSCVIDVTMVTQDKNGVTRKKTYKKSSGKKGKVKTMEYDSSKTKPKLDNGVYSGGPIDVTRC